MSGQEVNPIDKAVCIYCGYDIVLKVEHKENIAQCMACGMEMEIPESMQDND